MPCRWHPAIDLRAQGSWGETGLSLTAPGLGRAPGEGSDQQLPALHCPYLNPAHSWALSSRFPLKAAASPQTAPQRAQKLTLVCSPSLCSSCVCSGPPPAQGEGEEKHRIAPSPCPARGEHSLLWTSELTFLLLPKHHLSSQAWQSRREKMQLDSKRVAESSASVLKLPVHGREAANPLPGPILAQTVQARVPLAWSGLCHHCLGMWL